jgi:hypothetical protein
MGFRLYWRWKSGKRGRPRVPKEARDLIRRTSTGNPTWGAPRIHGELLKLGTDIAEPTVSEYMVRPKRPPSQTWKTFLRNHREVCRQLGVTEQTSYRWRKEYGGLRVEHARRLKQLEQENARLKKLVANQALDMAILRGAARGNS